MKSKLQNISPRLNKLKRIADNYSVYIKTSARKTLITPTFKEKFTMQTLDEIRNQLKAIHTFYAHVDKNKNVIAFDGIVVAEYRAYAYKITALCDNLHWRLRDVYYGLYVDGNTQKRLADKWAVTEKYVQILHKRLLLALQPVMPEKPQKPVKEKKPATHKSIPLKVVWNGAFLDGD